MHLQLTSSPNIDNMILYHCVTFYTDYKDIASKNSMYGFHGPLCQKSNFLYKINFNYNSAVWVNIYLISIGVKLWLATGLKYISCTLYWITIHCLIILHSHTHILTQNCTKSPQNLYLTTKCQNDVKHVSCIWIICPTTVSLTHKGFVL